MKLYTTESVAKSEGITMVIAQRWARIHGVTKIGNYYFWTEEDWELFGQRKKKPGPEGKGGKVI